MASVTSPVDRRGVTWGLVAVAIVVALTFIGSERLVWFDAALVGYLFGLVFAVFGVVYRYAVWLRRPPTAEPSAKAALAVSAVVWARFVGNELWTGLPDSVMPEFRAYAKPGLLAILAAHVVLCCWTAAAAFLFFRKRSSVPRVFVASLWIVSIVASGVLALQGLTGFQKDFSLGGFFATFARDMIGVVVWTAYMLQSKRVRATFRVRRADGRPSGNPAPGSGEGEPGREHVLS